MNKGGVDASPKGAASLVNQVRSETERNHAASNLESPRIQQASTRNNTRIGNDDQENPAEAKRNLKPETHDDDDGEEGGSRGEDISITFPQKASSCQCHPLPSNFRFRRKACSRVKNRRFGLKCLLFIVFENARARVSGCFRLDCASFLLQSCMHLLNVKS